MYVFFLYHYGFDQGDFYVHSLLYAFCQDAYCQAQRPIRVSIIKNTFIEDQSRSDPVVNDSQNLLILAIDCTFTGLKIRFYDPDFVKYALLKIHCFNLLRVIPGSHYLFNIS